MQLSFSASFGRFGFSGGVYVYKYTVTSSHFERGPGYIDLGLSVFALAVSW